MNLLSKTGDIEKVDRTFRPQQQQPGEGFVLRMLRGTGVEHIGAGLACKERGFWYEYQDALTSGCLRSDFMSWSLRASIPPLWSRV
jgi:hypothetical protein